MNLIFRADDRASGQTARYAVYIDTPPGETHTRVLVGFVGDKFESYSGIQGRSGRPLGRYRYWRFVHVDGRVSGWHTRRRDAVAELVDA